MQIQTLLKYLDVSKENKLYETKIKLMENKNKITINLKIINVQIDDQTKDLTINLETSIKTTRINVI